MRHRGSERVAAETVRVRYCMQRWEKDHVTTTALSDGENIEYDPIPELFGNPLIIISNSTTLNKYMFFCISFRRVKPKPMTLACKMNRTIETAQERKIK